MNTNALPQDIESIVESNSYRQAKAAYCMALKLFAGGDKPEANEMLDLAFSSNYWISLRLLGRKETLTVWDRKYQQTRESEVYARRYGAEWEQTPGAIKWLQSRLRRENRKQNLKLQSVLSKVPREGKLAWLLKRASSKLLTETQQVK